MLHVSCLSGETYAVPIEVCGDAKSLKACLSCSWGLPPRFQQRLVLEGSELEDSKLLEASMELNLLLLPLRSTHKDELFTAIRLGSASQVARLPLQLASAAGDVDIVRLVLEARAGTDLVDGHRLTALMYASNHGHPGVVELLLQAGAYASASSSEVVQLLLAAPLQMASADGNADIVRLLLEARAGTDLVDGCGDTALMRASSGGHASVVNLLLQAGADASLVNCLGYTSLMLASSGDHSEVVELLLADHTNPDTPSQGQVAVEGLPEASEASLLDDSGSTVVDHSDFYRRAVKFLRDNCCGLA